MIDLKGIFSKVFPSNPKKAEIGSIELNIWLANITGIPLIGLRTNESHGLKALLLIYGIVITIFVEIIYVIFEFYDLLMNYQDLDNMTQNICLSLTHLAGLVKTLNLFYRLADIKIALNKIRYVVKTYTLTEDQTTSFQDGEVENKTFLSIYMSIVGTTGFLGMVMLYMNPEAVAGKIFPYRVLLPSWFPIQIQLLYMGLSVIILSMQIVAVDFLNVSFINQIRSQLNVLQLSFDLLKLDIIESSNGLQKADSKDLLLKNNHLEKLHSIVEHHCLLKDIRQDVESIFRHPILFQFFASAIIFAMTGFQATVRTGGSNGAILIYFYCGCIFCELFLYCWCGNEVYEQSKILAFSGYNSSWYFFNSKYRKSLLIFMSNAQEPFLFTAGGFIGLLLPSFAGILSKSYSAIALLRQVYGRE